MYKFALSRLCRAVAYEWNRSSGSGLCRFFTPPFVFQAANYAEDRDKAHMLRAEHQLVGSKFDELDREGTGAIDTEEVVPHIRPHTLPPSPFTTQPFYKFLLTRPARNIHLKTKLLLYGVLNRRHRDVCGDMRSTCSSPTVTISPQIRRKCLQSLTPHID